MKIEKAVCVKISVEKNLFLNRFVERVSVQHALVTAQSGAKNNVEGRYENGMRMHLLEGGPRINKLEYYVRIVMQSQAARRLTGLVETKDLEQQTMPRSVEAASRLREKLTKRKEIMVDCRLKIRSCSRQARKFRC